MFVTQSRFSEAAKRLKRILQDDLGEETRLNHCQKALAEGLDFDSTHHACTSFPTEVTWNAEWCVNHLADEGYVSSEAVARKAVAALEARIPWLKEGECTALSKVADSLSHRKLGVSMLYRHSETPMTVNSEQ